LKNDKGYHESCEVLGCHNTWLRNDERKKQLTSLPLSSTPQSLPSLLPFPSFKYSASSLRVRILSSSPLYTAPSPGAPRDFKVNCVAYLVRGVTTPRNDFFILQILLKENITYNEKKKVNWQFLFLCEYVSLCVFCVVCVVYVAVFQYACVVSVSISTLPKSFQVSV